MFYNHQYGQFKTVYDDKSDIIREKKAGNSSATSKLITVPSGLGSVSRAKASANSAKTEEKINESSAYTDKLPLAKTFPVNGTAADNIAAINSYIAEADAKIAGSKISKNPYKETFYDKDGNVIKENFMYDKDGQIHVWSTQIKFDTPKENGVVSVTKTDNQIEVKVSQSCIETFEGPKIFDRGYKEYDLSGNIKREVFANNGAYNKIPDSYEIRYNSDGKIISAKQEVYAKDGSKIETFIDYEKEKKRIEKSDNKQKRYEVSETGINDKPKFVKKQDIIKDSTDVWVNFPSLKKVLTNNTDFDCVSVKNIVETLRKQTYACQKIISLKKTDGTQRFTQKEAAELILNCREFLDSPRLMKFITTPNADGSLREIYQIWRGYIDSDKIGDITNVPDDNTIDNQVIIKLANSDVKNYIERIINTNGDSNALTDLLNEINDLPDIPETRAIGKSISKCIMGAGKNIEHIADFIKTELTEELAQEAAMASVNKDAVLSDEVYAAAFELSPRINASDKRHVAELMNKKAGIVEKMMTYKNPDGSKMFTPKTIAEFFLNCESIINTTPGKIFTTIESDFFQKYYTGWENKTAALWKCLYH